MASRRAAAGPLFDRASLHCYGDAVSVEPSVEPVIGNEQWDAVIVGGGVVGLATAYRLLEHHPSLRVVVLEKESTLASHQTGHNSGVIHSGLYYRPGSYRATNCVRGREQLVAFARQHGVAHDVCGKVVVAIDGAETHRLRTLYHRGRENGLTDIEIIDADGLRDIEPHCAGRAAIWVPYTGIIDFRGLVEALAGLVRDRGNGSRVDTNCTYLGVRQDGGELRVGTSRGIYRTRHLITCAGLQADRVARTQTPVAGLGIVGFRGDFYQLVGGAERFVNNLIYPVPNPRVPFLGVHFTRMVGGGIECGPNAVFTFKREGYRKTDFDLTDTAEALSFRGTWRLFRKYARFGVDEYLRAFSKRLFLSRVQRLIPAVRMRDLEPHRSGVRALAIDRSGAMLDDFVIKRRGRAIHVLNAPSPAATAALAIGEQIQQHAARWFTLASA